MSDPVDRTGSVHPAMAAFTTASLNYDVAQQDCFRLETGSGVREAVLYLRAVSDLTVAAREYSRTIVNLLSIRRLRLAQAE